MLSVSCKNMKLNRILMSPHYSFTGIFFIVNLRKKNLLLLSTIAAQMGKKCKNSAINIGCVYSTSSCMIPKKGKQCCSFPKFHFFAKDIAHCVLNGCMHAKKPLEFAIKWRERKSRIVVVI